MTVTGPMSRGGSPTRVAGSAARATAPTIPGVPAEEASPEAIGQAGRAPARPPMGGAIRRRSAGRTQSPVDLVRGAAPAPAPSRVSRSCDRARPAWLRPSVGSAGDRLSVVRDERSGQVYPQRAVRPATVCGLLRGGTDIE